MMDDNASRSREVGRLTPVARAIAKRARALHQGGRARTARERTGVFQLAHYTSLDVIVSMLQTQDGGLRLSDSSTMNDPEEGQNTEDGRRVWQLLQRCGEESWPWKRYGAAHMCCFVGIARGEAQHRGDRVIDAGDDLLFWRLYGSECRGVSIAIAPHISEDLVKNRRVEQVIYGDEPPSQTDLAGIEALLHDLDELRRRAQGAEVWSEVQRDVLPVCDRLLGQRFLHKRSHYQMEREYRAVAFVTMDDNEAVEDARFVARGRHVQYGRVRTYVQTRELRRKVILTTKSQITIGSNVPDAAGAKRDIARLVSATGTAPNVISLRVSEIPYRPR